MGFSIPEQGSKYMMPVANTHLIKVESPWELKLFRLWEFRMKRNLIYFHSSWNVSSDNLLIILKNRYNWHWENSIKASVELPCHVYVVDQKNKETQCFPSEPIVLHCLKF